MAEPASQPASPLLHVATALTAWCLITLSTAQKSVARWAEHTNAATEDSNGKRSSGQRMTLAKEPCSGYGIACGRCKHSTQPEVEEWISTTVHTGAMKLLSLSLSLLFPPLLSLCETASATARTGNWLSERRCDTSCSCRAPCQLEHRSLLFLCVTTLRTGKESTADPSSSYSSNTHRMDNHTFSVSIF
jgi:hypothetical protein